MKSHLQSYPSNRPGVNNLLNPKSSYKRILMAPPCRLIHDRLNDEPLMGCLPFSYHSLVYWISLPCPFEGERD